MRNLLLFNLATDADDPILSFTTVWINRLAQHFDHVDVITMRAGRIEVAPNVGVWSVGKEQGKSEFQRALAFYRVLAGRLTHRRYAACFAHMMPLFAVMGAPLLAWFGVPTTLWYTHRQADRLLALSVRLVRRVVTAAPDSFPLPTPKLRVTGHGIDTDFFAPAPPPAAASFLVVQVARLMKIKHQATLLTAASQVQGAQVVLVGGVPPEQSPAYREALIQQAHDLGITERVTFAGDQDREQVRDHYRAAHVAVNLSPVGLFDKAALESMAVGVPTLVSNPAFAPLLGGDAARLTIGAPDDSDGLAERLRALSALPAGERHVLGAALRQNVIAAHSLDGLMARLVSILLTGEMEGQGV